MLAVDFTCRMPEFHPCFSRANVKIPEILGKHVSTAGFFLTIKTENRQTTDAAIFWSGCGN